MIVLSVLILSGCAKPAPSPAPTPSPTQPKPPAPTPDYGGTVKIKWLGHAAFVIISQAGTKIITDPYAPSDRLTYAPVNESADIVTVSHDHSDHNNVAAVGGNPQVVRGTTEVKGIKFKGIPSYHDQSQGKQRGNNTIISFEVDGLRLVHLGDLGHLLDDKQVAEIGKVDILLIPVGGNFTIDASVATQVYEQLKPRVIVPMHYRTDRCTLPIADVDEFLKGKRNVTRLETSEMEFKAAGLPSDMQIIVFKPSR